MNDYYVLGLDPSLRATGYCVLNSKGNIVALGSTKKLKTSTPIPEVLDYLHNKVHALMDMEYEVIVIEDLPVNAMSAGKTGMAQGVIRLHMVNQNVLYPVPSTLKKFATGKGTVPRGTKGKARKEPMLKAFQEATGARCEDDNAVDAYWLARYGLAVLRGDEGHRVSEGFEEYLKNLKTLWGDRVEKTSLVHAKTMDYTVIMDSEVALK